MIVLPFLVTNVWVIEMISVKSRGFWKLIHFSFSLKTAKKEAHLMKSHICDPVISIFIYAQAMW